MRRVVQPILWASALALWSVMSMGNTSPAESVKRSHPLGVAHRGFSGKYPENTAASVRAAVEMGSDMVEIDVWRSQDGVVVVMHDNDVSRTTGAQGKLTEMNLEDIRKLDAGSSKDPAFAGERVPTLEEIVGITKGRAILVIEVKQSDIEEDVLKVLRAMDALHDVLIFSFYPNVIAKFTELEPTLPSIWLLDDPPKDAVGQREVLDTAAGLGASGVGTSVLELPEPFVRLCHLAGFPLAIWTVDIPAMQQHMKDLGVDYIITNRMDLLQPILDPAQ